jgi:hypothetical protein
MIGTLKDAPRRAVTVRDLQVGDMLNSGAIVIEVAHVTSGANRGKTYVDLLDGTCLEWNTNARTIVVDD